MRGIVAEAPAQPFLRRSGMPSDTSCQRRSGRGWPRYSSPDTGHL